LATRMVLAVNRHPLFGDHAGGQPQPETEKVRHGRMQIQAAMRLAAMQVQRHTQDSDVGHQQGEEDDLPPARLSQSASKKIEKPIHKTSRPRRGADAGAVLSPDIPLQEAAGFRLRPWLAPQFPQRGRQSGASDYEELLWHSALPSGKS